RLVAFCFPAAGVVHKALHLLVAQLVACEPDFLGVGHHDVITAINMRRVLGAMFAHEDGGDFRGNAAEHLVRGVNMMPILLDITGFGEIRLAWHGPTWL